METINSMGNIKKAYSDLEHENKELKKILTAIVMENDGEFSVCPRTLDSIKPNSKLTMSHDMVFDIITFKLEEEK